MAWQWDKTIARYRDSATGRFMARESVWGYLEQSIGATSNRVALFTQQVSSGSLSPLDWERAMRQEIKREYIRQYLLGRGGLAQMTLRDWGSVGGMLREQFRWLAQFKEGIVGLSEGQAAARSQMYINSAREAFEKANAKAYGLNLHDLPAYPGDGSTACLTNCRCNWRKEFEYTDGALTAINAYWERTAKESCPTCISRNIEWYPYRVKL